MAPRARHRPRLAGKDPIVKIKHRNVKRTWALHWRSQTNSSKRTVNRQAKEHRAKRVTLLNPKLGQQAEGAEEPLGTESVAL